MNEQLITRISALAVESVLFEVSAAPKPGLVTPYSNGAHRDMDYFTFLSSAAALHNCFDEMIYQGFVYREQPIKELLTPLRISGMKYEKLMFEFTKDINTHKGMIFSIGLLCGCIGWGYGKETITPDYICQLVARMCAGICEREYQGLDKKEKLTKGEQMYVKYGCTGARGEAESGYKTIGTVSLPKYRELRKLPIPVNDALVQTLLHLVAETNDTNIIARHDYEASVYAKKCAARAIYLGGILTDAGKSYIKDMEEDFITRYISPGGCADLLAATHFLYSLSEE